MTTPIRTYSIAGIVLMTAFAFTVHCKPTANRETTAKTPNKKEEKKEEKKLEPFKAPHAANLMRVVGTGAIKGYASADEKSESVFTVQVGEKVQFIEHSGDHLSRGNKVAKWTKVRAGEKEGWVFGGHLEHANTKAFMGWAVSDKLDSISVTKGLVVNNLNTKPAAEAGRGGSEGKVLGVTYEPAAIVYLVSYEENIGDAADDPAGPFERGKFYCVALRKNIQASVLKGQVGHDGAKCVILEKKSPVKPRTQPN